jgi:AcrR family transcriptional regulator
MRRVFLVYGRGIMKHPPLTTKTRPSQMRSHDTFELIVQTAGRLLEHIGFEQLTTNLVCKEAGLTPPALYRYFPNKYAILKELGDRLMAAQDDVACHWMDGPAGFGATIDEQVARAVAAQQAIIAITRAFPGNIAITRALRAIPMLKQIRIASRDAVAQRQAQALARVYPAIPPALLKSGSQMAIELLYASMEMVLEDPAVDSAQVIEGAVRAVMLYFADLQRRSGA